MNKEQKNHRAKFNIRAATEDEYERMSVSQRGWYDWWKDIPFPTPKEYYGKTMPPIFLFKDGAIQAQGYHEIVRNVVCCLRPEQPE